MLLAQQFLMDNVNALKLQHVYLSLVVLVIIIIMGNEHNNCVSGCSAFPDSNCVTGGFSKDGTTLICFTCVSGYTLIGIYIFLS